MGSHLLVGAPVGDKACVVVRISSHVRHSRNLHKQINTNQYSLTLHKRLIRQQMGESGLPGERVAFLRRSAARLLSSAHMTMLGPGAFFMFEISPILVQLTETSRSFMHFLTSVCAIIGGVFTGKVPQHAYGLSPPFCWSDAV
jgi:hypothetical protein